jgi:hypothetical protein
MKPAIFVAAACLGVILVLSAARGQTPPPGTQFECRQTWGHLLVCRDRKTGKVVSECRLNNMTNRWECVSR